MGLFDGMIERGRERRARRRGLRQRGYDAPAPQYNTGVGAGFAQAQGQGMEAAGLGRAGMQETMGMYRDMAQGNGPSVAEQQMQRGNDQAVANQMAMQAAGTSGNLGSAMRGASAAGAGMSMQANADAAQLRAAEQQAAMAGMAGLATNYTQGGLAQQQGAMGLRAGMAGQQLAADTQWGLGQRGLDLEQIQGNRGFGLGIMKGITGAAGTGASSAAMFLPPPIPPSDMRGKQNIVPLGGGEATEATRQAGASTFEYKPGVGPPGRRAGIMAQGLASTELGSAALGPEREDGLMTVDSGQLSTLNAATNAETIGRLDRLELMLQEYLGNEGSNYG